MVGYGLDYGELYRNLRYVGVLRPERLREPDPQAVSMYRYPLGRGRWLAAASARSCSSSAACCPGTRPAARSAACRRSPAMPSSQAASSCSSCALATLALVTLPYAAGDRPVGVDRWPPYLILLLVGLVGTLLRAWDLWSRQVLGLPDRSPGHLGGRIGLIVLARATFEIAQSPQGH